MFKLKQYQESGFPEKIISMLKDMTDEERKDWYAVSFAAMSRNKKAASLVEDRFGEASLYIYFAIETICYDSLSWSEKQKDYRDTEAALKRISGTPAPVKGELEREAEKSISKIQVARVSAGLSRAEMSRLFEIPIRTLENWEFGKCQPPAWAEKLILEKLEEMKTEV